MSESREKKRRYNQRLKFSADFERWEESEPPIILFRKHRRWRESRPRWAQYVKADDGAV